MQSLHGKWHGRDDIIVGNRATRPHTLWRVYALQELRYSKSSNLFIYIHLLLLLPPRMLQHAGKFTLCRSHFDHTYYGVYITARVAIVKYQFIVVCDMGTQFNGPPDLAMVLVVDLQHLDLHTGCYF